MPESINIVTKLRNFGPTDLTNFPTFKIIERNSFYYVAFDVVWEDVFLGEYKHTLIDSQSEIPLEYVGCVYV